MYLFSRTRRINTARGRAAMAKTVEIAARVSEISGYTISAWTTVFSPDFGTVRWTCRVEHLEELESINDKLAVSEDFGNMVEEADHLYSGPLQDSLVQLIHGAPTGDPPRYIQATTAQAANGSLVASLGLAVELAEAGSRITGQPTLVGTGVTGPYGQVVWISGAPDLATAEQANAALAADSSWAQLVDRASNVFQPGAATTMFRRIT